MSVHYHHHSFKVQAMQKPLPLRSLQIDREFCCRYTEDMLWIYWYRFKIKIKRNMSNQKNAFAGLKQHVWMIFERTIVPKKKIRMFASWKGDYSLAKSVNMEMLSYGRVFYQQKQQKMAVWHHRAQRPSWVGSNHLVRKVNAQFQVGART